jgi:hypothetical protein
MSHGRAASIASIERQPEGDVEEMHRHEGEEHQPRNDPDLPDHAPPRPTRRFLHDINRIVVRQEQPPERKSGATSAGWHSRRGPSVLAKPTDRG